MSLMSESLQILLMKIVPYIVVLKYSSELFVPRNATCMLIRILTYLLASQK